ncbi:MAG: hypothetical protein E7048_04320 [Lentisphaerae bacterium]|nr:hypothetical protein [Lentisphaerota bacterium]
MIWGWENSWYFFLAAALPVLLLLYWFRHRGKRFYTAALFLWDEGNAESRASGRITVQKLPLSFFLEATAILLLICGAAGFFTSSEEKFPPAVVVLNNAFPMKEKPLEQGAKKVKKYLSRFPHRRVIWLRCGRDVELLSRSDWKFDFEKQWNADDAEFDAGKALAYAGKNFPGSEVVIVTDRIPDNCSLKGVTLLCSGVAGNNLAVANARIKGERILLEIHSFSDREMPAQLKVNNRILESFVIGKEERKIFNFRWSGAQKQLEFTLESPGDSFEYDNKVLLLKESAVPVTYHLDKGLSTVEKRLVEEALKDNPDFQVVSENPELLIAPYSKELKKRSGSKLFFHRGKSPRFAALTPLFNEDEKILTGLKSSALKWAFYPGVQMAGKGVIFSDGTPLLSVEKYGYSSCVFHLNLAVEYSNLHRLPFWPGFFCNLAEYCRLNRIGPRENNIRSGELLVFNAARGVKRLIWEKAEVKGEFPVSEGKTLAQLKRCGLYTLDDGREKFRISVNPAVSELSDRRQCKTLEHYAELAPLTQGRALKKWSQLFIVGALLLLMFNYCWNFRSGK